MPASGSGSTGRKKKSKRVLRAGDREQVREGGMEEEMGEKTDRNGRLASLESEKREPVFKKRAWKRDAKKGPEGW